MELRSVGLREAVGAHLGQRAAVVRNARGQDVAEARRGWRRGRIGGGERLPFLQRRSIPRPLEHRGEPPGVFPALLPQKGGHRLQRGFHGLAVRRGRGFGEDENVQIAQVARHAAQPRQRLAKTLRVRGREDGARLADQHPGAAHRHAEIVHVHGLVRAPNACLVVAQHREQQPQQASNRLIGRHVGRERHWSLGRILAGFPRRERQQRLREAVLGRRQALLGAPLRGVAGGFAVAGQRTNPDTALGRGAAARRPLFFDDQPGGRLAAPVEQTHSLPPGTHATDLDEGQVFDQFDQPRPEGARFCGAGRRGSAGGLGQRHRLGPGMQG